MATEATLVFSKALTTSLGHYASQKHFRKLQLTWKESLAMKIRTMRWVDRWLGTPGCAVMTLHRWIFGRWRSPPKRVKRIVLVKLAEQGSTVLAHAAIYRAIERVGAENVFFLVFEENRFVLDQLGLIDDSNIVTIPTYGPIALVKGILAAIGQMRREKIDAAVDLEFFARSSAVLCYLSGASRRAGFHATDGGGPFRGDLMTHRLTYNPHLHTSETFAMQVESLNSDTRQLPAMDASLSFARQSAPLAQFTESEVEEIKSILQQASGQSKLPQLILLNPNCSDLLPLRMWPRQRYIELAKRLLERYPKSQIALTGAPGEESAAAKLVGEIASERCFSLAGKTTFKQLLVLYSQADVLVTNDSGPAHFATLTPVHVVTLFGPETPKLFAARTQRNHVLWAQLPCSPCVNAYNNRNSVCRNNLCMQKITVEQVFDQVCMILDGQDPIGRRQ